MTASDTTSGPNRTVSPTELLDIRERQWSARMRGCSLVAELQVKEHHARQVAKTLGVIYDRWADSPRATRIFHRWPACVAVAITSIAARDYRQGELWPELWAGLSCGGGQRDRTVWGQGFLTALNELGLPGFAELPMPYVGPMIMHTGIPTYCLDDYFRLIVQRRTLDPELEPDGFLSWATAADHRLGALDRPAARFLQYGSEYALDFVDRSFDLLDRMSEPAPALDGINLPPRVMVRAQELAAIGALHVQPRPVAQPSRARSERPRINLDPFGRGVEVLLPAVGDTPDGVARWSVVTDGIPHIIRSQAHWLGVAEAAPPTAFALLKPVRTVVVAMDGWTYQMELDVVDSDAPLLVFAEDGRRLSAEMPLPADNVWVAHPEDHHLIADQPITIIVEAQLPLGWAGWRLRQISLDGLQWLALDGRPATRRPVRGHLRPRIVTDLPMRGVTTPYGTPVLAEIPSIWLPADAAAETRWTVDIRRSNDSTIAAVRDYDLVESRTVTELWSVFPRPLLGSFDITVRGPLGRGMRRTVFVAERLDVQYTPLVRLFDQGGLAQARAELIAPIGAEASPSRLTFDTDERAKIVEYRTGDETEPLVITPPHLRVMHEQVNHSPVWSASPLRIPADIFAEHPGRLLVRVPQTGTIGPLQVIVGRSETQAVPSSGPHRDDVARFDLVRIADTINERQRAELVLQVGRPVSIATVRPRRLAEGVVRDAGGLRLAGAVPIEGLTAGVYARNAPWLEPYLTPVRDATWIPLPEPLINAGPLLVMLQVDDPWAPVEWPRWPHDYLVATGDGYLVTDDPQEVGLSRFVAGVAEMPDHVHDLRWIWTLIHLARHLCPAADRPRFLHACTEAIRPRAAEAVAALVNLGLEPYEIIRAVVSSGLAAAAMSDGLDAEFARKLWPTSPVLAVLAGDLSEPDTFEAAQQQCGRVIEEIVTTGSDRYACVGRFGPEVAQMLYMDPLQIEGIWRAANVVPQTLLDPDTRAVAARRLFDGRHRPDVKQAARSANGIVRTALDLVGHIPMLRTHIEARTASAGMSGLFAVPAASAALAILARLAARGDTAGRQVEQRHRADWICLAAGAPDLTIIDLILAELLVSQVKGEKR